MSATSASPCMTPRRHPCTLCHDAVTPLPIGTKLMAYETVRDPSIIATPAFRCIDGIDNDNFRARFRGTGDDLSLGRRARRRALFRQATTGCRKSGFARSADLPKSTTQGGVARRGADRGTAACRHGTDFARLCDYGTDRRADHHQSTGSDRHRDWTGRQHREAVIRRRHRAEIADRGVSHSTDCAWQSYDQRCFHDSRRRPALPHEAGNFLCASALDPEYCSEAALTTGKRGVARGG